MSWVVCQYSVPRKYRFILRPHLPVLKINLPLDINQGLLNPLPPHANSLEFYIYYLIEDHVLL